MDGERYDSLTEDMDAKASKQNFDAKQKELEKIVEKLAKEQAKKKKKDDYAKGKWGFVSGDGTRYDSLTDLMDAQVKQYGFPKGDATEKAIKEDEKKKKKKENDSSKWGFVSSDGTRYDTLTELLDAQVEKFGFPEIEGFEEYKKKQEQEQQEKENAEKVPKNEWSFIDSDGNRYSTLTEFIQAQEAKFGFPEIKIIDEIIEKKEKDQS